MPDNTVAILDSVTRFLDRQHGLYIDGKWCDSLSDARLAIYNPANGEQIASSADANAEDVSRAVTSAHQAFAPVCGHKVCPPSVSAFAALR